MSIPEQAPQQYQAPQQAAPTNFMEALSQGLHQAQQQKKQDFQNDQDRQALMLQRKQIQQQQASQVAQQKFAMLKPMLLNNAGMADKPEMQDFLKQTFDAMGMPIPKTPDGKFDTSVLKDQADPTELNRILSLPVGTARSVQLDAYSKTHAGVDPSMYTSDIAYTPKDTTAIGRMQILANHDKNLDEYAAERTHNQGVLASARTGMITQETKNLMVKNANIQADTQKLIAEASAIPQRMDNAKKMADAYVARANSYIAGRGSVTHSTWQALKQQSSMITSQYNKDNDMVANLEKNRAALIAGGVSDDDPQVATLNAQIDQFAQAAAAAKPSVDALQQAMDQNVTAQITAGGISSATGRPTTVVGGGSGSDKPFMKAPSGVSDGDYPKSKWGHVKIVNGEVFKVK